MSKLELPGTLNFSPGPLFCQLSLPASLYSQPPATHSMISGAPVLKVSWEGNTTPTDFFVPSARVTVWLTHLPSKYTLACAVTLAPSIFSVVIASGEKGAILAPVPERPVSASGGGGGGP